MRACAVCCGPSLLVDIIRARFFLYMIAFLQYLLTTIYKCMSRITLFVLMNLLVRVPVGWGRGAGLRKLLILDVYQTTAEF